MFDELGEQFTPVENLQIVDPAVDDVTCGGEDLSGDDLERAAVYCVDENVVVLDGPGLVDAMSDDIGDFAVAAEVARLWALAAQSQLGSDGGDQADLQADCLTGAVGQHGPSRRGPTARRRARRSPCRPATSTRA